MKSEPSEDPLIAVVSRALTRWLPPVDPASVSEEKFQVLKSRNGRLDAVCHLLFVVGLVGGLLLPRVVWGSPLRFKAADIGVLFGMGVLFPTVFMLFIGVIKGKGRLLEFLTYYSVKYRIDARRLLLYIYVPLTLIGAMCAGFSYFVDQG